MKKYCVAILFVVLAVRIHAQNPVFSQYYTTALYLNPALAGMERDVLFGINYRSQWSNVNLPFRTFQFTYIHPILKHGVRNKQLGGVGGSFFSDEAGTNREFVTQGISLAAAYNFHLDKSGNNIIALAAQLAVYQKRVSLEALQWSSQYQGGNYDQSLPGENQLSERIIYPQINTGALWNHFSGKKSGFYRGFYNGVAVTNMIRPQGFYESQQDSPQMLYRIHGGLLTSLTGELEFSPNYLVEIQNGVQLNIGASIAYDLSQGMNLKNIKGSLGAWYRVQDAFILTTGLIHPSWNFGFSYDSNTSNFGRNFKGANAFEISLAYKIKASKGFRKFSSPLI